ncbi:MAG: fibronectin type III domain-containing protein [Deltaproteobacteria bacterium]|nr:fibronectin type III domain-containing protein [Deltaproteobacteria bacterium]
MNNKFSKVYHGIIIVTIALLLIAGCSGKNGSNGATGPQGTAGTNGSQGSQGPQGGQGLTGPTMPVIQSLSIQGVPAIPGNSVTATVIAQSAQGLALTYTWTVSNGWTVATGAGTPKAAITAPTGYGMTGTATVEVSDTQGMYAIGMIVLSTKDSSLPIINTMSASPNPADPGGVMQAIVNAYDPDGNVLHFAWAASDGWTITGYGATATVIAPSTYNTGGYITATVSDDYGGAVTGTIAVGTIIIIPPSPLNLTASLPGSNQVLLNWNASSSATGYNVYEAATAGGPYSAIGTTTTTGYTVTGLISGTTYYFAVTAMNSIGESGYSNEVPAIPQVITRTFPTGTWPFGIAIDAAGDVWIANIGSANVTELSPTGTTITTVSTGTSPVSVAIDNAGNVWVSNQSSNNLTEISPAGTVITTVSAGSNPRGIAIDASGNIWAADWIGNSVTELDSAGAFITSIAAGTNPYGIAIDASGNVWVSDQNSSSITEISPAGTIITTVTVGSGPMGIAVDPSGNVWVASYDNNDVTELDSTGFTIGTYAVGTNPIGLAIDGSGNIWVINEHSNNVTELSPTGTTIGTYAIEGSSNGVGLAIDASGNVWVTEYSNNKVIEIIGITKGPQYFPCSGTGCPVFQGGGNL